MTMEENLLHQVRGLETLLRQSGEREKRYRDIARITLDLLEGTPVDWIILTTARELRAQLEA